MILTLIKFHPTSNFSFFSFFLSFSLLALNPSSMCSWLDAVLWNPFLTMEASYKYFVCVENAKVVEIFTAQQISLFLMNIFLFLFLPSFLNILKHWFGKKMFIILIFISLLSHNNDPNFLHYSLKEYLRSFILLFVDVS